MNCRGIRRRLSEYLDGELPAPQQAAIAAHLEVCAGCREEAEGFRRAGEALRTLSAVEVAPDLTTDLHRRLAAPAARRSRLGWASAAAVAAVGIAIGCLVWLSPPPPAPGPLRARRDVAAPQVAIEPPEQALPVTEEQPEVEAPRELYRAPVQVVTSEKEAEQPVPVDVLLSRESDEMDLPSAEERPVVAGVVEEPRPAPRELTRALGRRSEAEYGVVLLLGRPEPVLPSSYCYLEVSFPDGTKSILDQSVERDAGGEPRVVQLSYQQVSPETESVNQGG
jgi:hypothetical protein